MGSRVPMPRLEELLTRAGSRRRPRRGLPSSRRMPRRLALCLALLLVAVLPVSAARAVVGGKPVPPGQLPFVANVTIGGSFGCTGTLVAPQWVLTAGHCGSLTGSVSEGLVPSPVSLPPSEYALTLGTVYASGEGGEHHTVRQVRVDTDYVATNGTGNDVTLLELDRPSKIAPMRVVAPSERSRWVPGVLSTVAGFGTTSQGTSEPPRQMQVARVPIQSDAYCAKAYAGGLNTATDDGSYDAGSMLCAGYPQGGTDTCQGDSGGPLLVSLAGGGTGLVGATSFGNGCAQPGKPGVYARLAEGPIRHFLQSVVPAALAPNPPPRSCPRLRGRLSFPLRLARGSHPVRARVYLGARLLRSYTGRSARRLRTVRIARPHGSRFTITIRVRTSAHRTVVIVDRAGCHDARTRREG